MAHSREELMNILIIKKKEFEAKRADLNQKKMDGDTMLKSLEKINSSSSKEEEHKTTGVAKIRRATVTNAPRSENNQEAITEQQQPQSKENMKQTQEELARLEVDQKSVITTTSSKSQSLSDIFMEEEPILTRSNSSTFQNKIEEKNIQENQSPEKDRTKSIHKLDYQHDQEQQQKQEKQDPKPQRKDEKHDEDPRMVNNTTDKVSQAHSDSIFQKQTNSQQQPDQAQEKEFSEKTEDKEHVQEEVEEAEEDDEGNYSIDKDINEPLPLTEQLSDMKYQDKTVSVVSYFQGYGIAAGHAEDEFGGLGLIGVFEEEGNAISSSSNSPDATFSLHLFAIFSLFITYFIFIKQK